MDVVDTLDPEANLVNEEKEDQELTPREDQETNRKKKKQEQKIFEETFIAGIAKGVMEKVHFYLLLSNSKSEQCDLISGHAI